MESKRENGFGTIEFPLNFKIKRGWLMAIVIMILLFAVVYPSSDKYEPAYSEEISYNQTIFKIQEEPKELCILEKYTENFTLKLEGDCDTICNIQ